MEIHLEQLLGKPVLDSNGHRIGRIEEIRAEQYGDIWLIHEYLVGSTALLERLSAWHLGLGLLKLLGARKLPGGYRIPWDKLDLTKPDHPRLTCTKSELEDIHHQLEQANQQS